MSDLPTSGVSVLGLTEPLSPTLRLASASVELAAPAILPVYCLVCNVQGLEQVYWNVHASFTNTASVPLADKLLECVQSGLRATDLGRHYSEYVCGTCATQLNLVEEYEAALVRVRAEVKQGFWQTLIARGQISVTAEARDSETPPPAVATSAPLAAATAATAAPLAVIPKAVATLLSATPRDSGDAPVESRARHPGPSSDDVVSERTQEVTSVTSVTQAVKSAVQGPVKVEVTAQVIEPEQLQEQTARVTGTEQLQEQQQLAKQEDMIVGNAAPGPEETSAQSAGRCSSRPLRSVPRPVIDDPDDPDSPRPDESKADGPIQRSSGRTKTRTDWTEVDKHYRPVVDADDGGTERFQCTVCFSKIKDRKEVRKHVRRHLGMIKLLKCGFCEYRCYRPSNLAIHERRHTGERPFTCEVCGIGFKSNDGLNVHRRTHTGERPYQCEHCHKRFTQHSSLQIHKQVHSPQKRHICDYCGKSFTQLGNLKCHLRVHTGETPYPCPTCGHQFRSDYHLKVHQIEHTGRRPHQCRDCDLGFLTAHKLNLHRATHTGDKVGYPCGVCNKRLTTRKSLRDHERLHTGERPFPCATCTATFRTETLLRAHRRQHAVELQCAACGQTCRTEAALAAHQRTYHQPAAEPAAAAKPGRLQLLQISDSVSLAPAVLVTIGSPPPAQGESILGV